MKRCEDCGASSGLRREGAERGCEYYRDYWRSRPDESWLCRLCNLARCMCRECRRIIDVQEEDYRDEWREARASAAAYAAELAAIPGAATLRCGCGAEWTGKQAKDMLAHRCDDRDGLRKRTRRNNSPAAKRERQLKKEARDGWAEARLMARARGYSGDADRRSVRGVSHLVPREALRPVPPLEEVPPEIFARVAAEREEMAYHARRFRMMAGDYRAAA